MRKKSKKTIKYNLNQKSFYFEDYLETNKKNKYSQKNNLFQDRIYLLFFLFLSLILIFSIRIIHVSLNKFEIYNSEKTPKKFTLLRRDIVDRNGHYLSKTVSSIDIGISTAKVIDKKKLLINLKYIFPNKDYKKIKSKLENKKFFYFEKKISDENYEKIMRLGDQSIQPEERLTRIYPEKNLFSHIIGQIDNDNNGISGLEKSLDNVLKNSSKSIKLTVDKDIQFLIRDELIKFNEVFKTKGSAAVLMDVNNGQILSLVSLPDFDPNKRKRIADVNFINRVTKGVYEFGSVFKTFTLAAAFDQKIIEPQTKFLDLPKSITCAGFPIREYDEKIPSDLTAEQILIRSGNIGSVRIGQEVGVEKFKLFLSKLGLMNEINFDIEEVGRPLNFSWGKCPLATASFGHGITTTLLQVVKAYAIIVNGGFYIDPVLIKNDKTSKKEKILDKNVSKKILPILRKIVTTNEGTANLANVNGYEIGGKTGTANKSSAGGYVNKKINTFVSIFPTTKPKFILAVMLDEPQINSDYIYKYRDGSGFELKGSPRNTAGWNSVETTGHIVEKIGPILATKYSEFE